MIYMIDSADIKAVEYAFNTFPMSGVTTNPTLIAQEKRNFLSILQDLREVIGSTAYLHIQPISVTAEGIIAEAKYLTSKLGSFMANTYIKIPVIPEGIKAMRLLKQEGYNITATAIVTPQQALMAATAGAEYLAPYINRIENIGGDSIKTVQDIVTCLKVGNLTSAKVLGASFKNTLQVHNTILAGAHSVTINPTTLNNLLEHPLTEWSVKKFIEDWEEQYQSSSIIGS